MSTETLDIINETTNPERFLPYAKDHDRLQLALLYIEAASNRYEEINTEIKGLRASEAIIQRSLAKLSGIREDNIKRYVHERHPGKYVDSTGHKVVPDPDDRTRQSKKQSKGWRDQEIERVFSMERGEIKALTHVLKSIELLEDEQSALSECVAGKEAILKLIKELHATAFDGYTPEFPHEDQLEGLVEVAKATLKGEQAVLDKLCQLQEGGLVKLREVAGSALGTLFKITSLLDKICLKFNREGSISLIDEFREHKMLDLCNLAAQLCQAWKEEAEKHFSDHPDTTLSPRAQSMIPQVDAKEMMEALSQVSSLGLSVQYVKRWAASLYRAGWEAKAEIRAAINVVKWVKEDVQKSVTKAKAMVYLRQRQLCFARSQILDHIIDPEKCPLEQRAEQLPDYPEQITIHDLPMSHPSVPRLLAQSETYSIAAYVNDIAHSRLSRVRRTTHPPVLDPGRYQPPVYDELEDPELLARRYQRDVPPVEGDATDPDYEGLLQTEPSELRPVVQAELSEAISKARRQLGLKSKAQQDEFNDMITTVMSMLEGSNIPLIMPGLNVRR